MNRLMLISLIMFLSASIYAQPTWTSISSGNWGSSSTWQTSGGASGVPPHTLKDFHRVIITNGYTVTMNDDVIMEDNAFLSIEDGAKLRMGSSPDDAPTFTMKSSGNQFYIFDATYESMIPGSGGNMLLEAGLVDWQDANVYISGNFIVKDDLNNFNNINVCVRVAQEILFEGVGSVNSYAVMSDAFYVSALEGTGNLTIKDNSYISSNSLRLNGTNSTTNVELFSSHINGNIYSINAGQKLVITGMSGSPSLDYWCAQEIESNLDYFTGPKIQNCSIAGEICEGVVTGISQDLEMLRNEISLNPNPAKGNVNLAGAGKFDSVELYDLNGKLRFIHFIDKNDNLELELSQLNSGIYFMKLSGSEGTLIKKLIKE